WTTSSGSAARVRSLAHSRTETPPTLVARGSRGRRARVVAIAPVCPRSFRLTPSDDVATLIERMFAKGGEMTLTARQQEIWEFLVGYVDAHGYPPTVREIGEAVGLAWPSTVYAHLTHLERAGLLRPDPTKPPALEL